MAVIIAIVVAEFKLLIVLAELELLLRTCFVCVCGSMESNRVVGGGKREFLSSQQITV